jgi:hypothetical protein
VPSQTFAQARAFAHAAMPFSVASTRAAFMRGCPSSSDANSARARPRSVNLRPRTGGAKVRLLLNSQRPIQRR